MGIKLYTFLYNEEEILPYFLKHYSTIVDKIVVYNNYSTDNSIQILKDWKECEIEIIEYDTNDKFDELTLLDLKNNCWKKDKDSEYVIVCDIDELLYHPDLKSFIKKNSMIDYFTPSGYHMIGEEIPTDHTKQIYDIIQNGVEDVNYGKNILFKRNSVEETYYAPGAHLSSFKGTKRLINCQTDQLKLLHYKWLSPEYVTKKYKHYQERMSDHSKERGWGIHYELTDNEIIEKYNNLKEQSIKIV
jgi:hypothetical protein